MEKITKRMALAVILSSLNEVATAEGAEFVLGSVPGKPTKEGQPTTIDVTVADAIAYCENELNLLASKSGAIKKPTATQQANEVIKDGILSFLDEHAGEKFTCSGLVKACPACADLSTPKVSALINQMVGAGLVVKTTEKRVSYFQAG